MKRDSFQIVPNAAVIIGLAILVYEVRESNTQATGASALEVSKTWSDRQLTLMGENPSGRCKRTVGEDAGEGQECAHCCLTSDP